MSIAPVRVRGRWRPSVPGRRRLGVVAALVTPLLFSSLLVTPAASADPPGGADRSSSDVRAVNRLTVPLSPGQSAWVGVVWTADRTVTGWSTKVTAPAGVAVGYPSTRGGTDTSLYGSDTLVGHTIDFTAFKLAVPYSRRTSFPVTITSTYQACTSEPCTASSARSPQTTTVQVLVPVLPAFGKPLVQKTTQLTIRPDSDGYQQISFTAGPTDLFDFSVSVGALPAGLQVAYPGGKGSSGLNGDSTLHGRSTDFVGVRFIAGASLAPGTYTIPLTIHYTAATAVSIPGSVTLVVS